METFAPDGLAVFVTAEVLQCGRVEYFPRMVVFDDLTEVIHFLYQLSLKQHMTQTNGVRLFLSCPCFKLRHKNMFVTQTWTK